MMNVCMHMHKRVLMNYECTEVEGTANQTNLGVDRRQTHLHPLQPLSQCSDLIPKVTLPLTQAVDIPPRRQEEQEECDNHV